MTPAMPTGRTGQATALGLTGLLLAFLWFVVASPLNAWYAERAQLILQREKLVRVLAIEAAAVPALLRRAEKLGAGAAAHTALLAGATDAIAGAALQEHLQRMAAVAGTRLTSVDTLLARSAGPWRRIGVRVTLSATWPVLMRLLRAIDLATPRMLVGDLEIQASPFRSGKAEPALDAVLTIFAFRRGQAPAHPALEK